MENGNYVEITLDVNTATDKIEITESKLDHGIKSEGKTSEFDRLRHNISSVQTELGRIRRQSPNSDLKLTGLRFLNGVPWESVEKKFTENAVDCVLAKEKLGLVIGMEDSEEFVMELYNAITRRLRLYTSNGIEMEFMCEIWTQLNEQNFESRLQLFFDLCDKNEDGRLSEEEIREAIELSASTNKLNNLKTQAADYATLIMNELDPEHLEHIEIWQLEPLFSSRHIVRTLTNPENHVELLRALKRTRFHEKSWKAAVTNTEHYLQTWMDLMVPASVHAFDRGLTFMDQSHPVNIVKAIKYPENVLALYIKKPYGFKYKIGTYMLFKCPEISSSEWHPLPIVSAPNDDDICVLTDNSLGEWIATLQEKFGLVTASASDSSLNPEIGYESKLQKRTIPNIIMKGPYGVPAQDYKKYDIVLVIGFGLGAALYSSILKDLLNNLQESGTQDLERKKGPHKSYFYWVTSHQSSFDVFKDVFNKSADYVSDNVIEMHNYLTSMYEEGDARSTMVQIVQSLQHAKTGVDVISGTRIKTHFGAPNWKDVFVQLALKHKSKKIGVYYSGSNEQMKLIRKLCQDFSYENTTHFHFHFHKNLF